MARRMRKAEAEALAWLIVLGIPIAIAIYIFSALGPLTHASHPPIEFDGWVVDYGYSLVLTLHGDELASQEVVLSLDPTAQD